MEETLVFKLAMQHYGLPVHQVTEVIRMVAVTTLPNLPPTMIGMINYRGDVIPLMDMRRVFEVPAQKVRLNTPIIIAQVHGRRIGLLVDAVEGVEIAATDQVSTVDNPHVSGILKTADKSILMVDLKRLN